MNNLKKIFNLSVCAFLFVVGFTSAAFAQQSRPRVVKTVSSQPINQPPSVLPNITDKNKSLPASNPANASLVRPTLMNKITVVEQPKQPLVKKTAASSPLNVMAPMAADRMVYESSTTAGIQRGIQSRLGIPYRYGSSGPNRYDCSGFVWSVFNDAGINFTRSSARSLWAASEPVSGDERYKFGTLVFMNGLGHMGIVADENGFYHASSSKGITYSPFKGYWEKRITGFRKLKSSTPTAAVPALIHAAK